MMKRWIKISILGTVGILMGGCVAQSQKPQETFPCATYQRDESPTKEKTIKDPVKMSTDAKQKYGTVYEIFVGSFHDTNNDGIGDLKGITEKLDYIKELGFDALWLTPVHPSSTYHKYDVIDYQAIDSQFGTLQDYETLISEAHKRGMRIIQDLVINHVSIEHPWFQDLVKKGRESQYCSYFVLRQKDASYKNLGDYWYPMNDGLAYYASFWEKMPELRLGNPAVQQELDKNIAFWQQKGVDGFRLDASGVYFNPDEYPSSYEANRYDSIQLVKYLHAEALKRNPETYFVTETWDTADAVAPFYAASDASFNFDLAKATLSTVRGTIAEDYKATYASTKKANEAIYAQYTDAVFLTNHDQNRVASVLPTLAEQKLAASILLTTPGTAYVYYGEEIGMKGEKPDESIREPMKWGNTQFNNPAIWKNNPMMNQMTQSQQEQAQNPNSLYTHYKKMLATRQKMGSLQQSRLIFLDADPMVLAYQVNQTLVIHNLSPKNKIFTENMLMKATETLFGDAKVTGNTVELSGQSTLIVKLSE